MKQLLKSAQPMAVVLLIGLFVSACHRPPNTRSKFDVQYSENVETYFLAELLAVKHRKTNVQWENHKLRTCKEYEPIVKRALDRFDTAENAGFAKETAAFCDTLVSYGYGNDIVMPVLLQLPAFSNYSNEGFRLPDLALDEQKKQQLTRIVERYLAALHQFYEKQDVAGFLSENSRFYEGAIGEIKAIIPADFTKAMEEYYGEKRYRYIALVSPMEIWPIEENEGRGISATVEKNGQKTVYEVMSPFVQVPAAQTASYSSFGFNYEPTARFLTIHEFSHSFVNPAVASYRQRIEASSRLFTDSLRQKMASKGVGNWYVYVIESLVRLGEIRIAALQKDFVREKRLRQYHTETEHFIFLPQLEQAILGFESNRAKYPQWKDYLPALLEVFEKSDAESVDAALR